MTAESNKNETFFSFICITFLFFAWGFITCMNDLLIPKFKADFDLSQLEANLIQSAFFGAFFIVSLVYFLLSTFKGDPINKIGYKNGLVLGLVVCGLGCLLFYPAGETHTYSMFLLALLTLGCGVTIIQIAANPYISILGDESSATSRLNLSQGINSLGYVIAPLIGGLLLFGNNVYSNAGGVDAVKFTYVGLGVCFFVLAIIIKCINLPEFKTREVKKSATNIFDNKFLIWGLIAIFFYVGSEVTIGSILINYLGDATIVGLPAHDADKYLSFYWGGLMIGRLVGAISLGSTEGLKKYGLMVSVAVISTLIIFGNATFKNYLTNGVHIDFVDILPFVGMIALNFVFFFIGGKSSGRTVAFFSIAAAALTVIAMMATGNVALWAIIGIGLFNSIMWSNIFTLSIRGMKDNTSKASSLLVMMIVGGAIMPAVQGALSDNFGIRASLIIVVVGYVYLTFFGLKGSKLKAINA